VEVDLRRLLGPPAARADRQRRAPSALSDKVNLAQKLALVHERFAPKIVARFNEHKVMVGKVQGEFVWHSHPETDDFFLVVSGRLTIDLRDRSVELGPGELFVVPRGVEHRPRADEETEILLIEPVGTPNTGDSTEREPAPEAEI
jgi:mannose-6-phosphate isomerase-like protein (cupin superfamily)